VDSQRRHSKVYSFEFFPPKTDEGVRKLRIVREEFAQLQPRFFSVTFGAGGSTQARTFETVAEIQASGSEAAPHLSCIGSTREALGELLDDYRQQGIHHIVALRGDMPSGMQEPGELAHANELVTFIRERTGDHFFIEVAAYPEFHPQSEQDPAGDLDRFRDKVNAGADAAITQYFYNAESYYRFVDDCEARGLDIPIVPGIMPITNYHNLVRFSDACGAEIPRWLRLRMAAYADDPESLTAFGTEVVTNMCRQLLEQGAPGLHFYTMNRTQPTVAIWQNLGLSTD
jgi:methylenetetrahydrofolate reductase (NADPH)